MANVHPVSLALHEQDCRQRSNESGKLSRPAAAVNVDEGAHEGADHGAAFDMPPGATGAPGAVPLRIPLLGRLPQGKVRGGALARVDPHPLPRRPLVLHISRSPYVLLLLNSFDSRCASIAHSSKSTPTRCHADPLSCTSFEVSITSPINWIGCQCNSIARYIRIAFQTVSPLNTRSADPERPLSLHLSRLIDFQSTTIVCNIKVASCAIWQLVPSFETSPDDTQSLMIMLAHKET